MKIMKIKLIFLTAFLVGSLAAMQAQYVNEVPISELDADYVMIWSDLGPLLSSKITVRIDYGQGGRTPQITDEKRRVISFNGMIAAINMMSKSGFEIDRIIRDPKNDTDYYYMKRRAIQNYSSSSGTVDYDAGTHKR